MLFFRPKLNWSEFQLSFLTFQVRKLKLTAQACRNTTAYVSVSHPVECKLRLSQKITWRSHGSLLLAVKPPNNRGRRHHWTKPPPEKEACTGIFRQAFCDQWRRGRCGWEGREYPVKEHNWTNTEAVRQNNPGLFWSFFDRRPNFFWNNWRKLNQFGHNFRKAKLVNTITAKFSTIFGQMTEMSQWTKQLRKNVIT